MCGVCGAVWTDRGQGPSDETLARMTERLSHRGPDDSGAYRDAHAALGFRRLSIIDVAGSRQPLSNEDGSVWLVFNGEIYNFQSLRKRLEARGHVLRTAGDAEVLVHLYEDEGPNLFSLVRGMFAFGLWDIPRRTLLLGRDRLGQKPLVYRLEGDRLWFASELKSLLATTRGEWNARVDLSSLDQFMTYGYVPHPASILEGVFKLPPAHYAIWCDGVLSQKRYWTPDWNHERLRPVDEDVEELRETLSSAVREQMVSDVSLGAFLSGGVDSTVIVGLMQSISNRPVKTFSIAFDDPAFDETSYAELAARRLGTEHQSFRVQPRAWETLPKLASQFDEPFADSSALPTWHVAEQTRAAVTVALTGDAGDELFGGYDRYRALAITEKLAKLPTPARRLIGGPIARTIPSSSRAKTRLRSVRRLLEGLGESAGDRYLTWMTLFPEAARLSLYSPELLDSLAARDEGTGRAGDPHAVFSNAWNSAPGRDPVTRAMVADVLTYLPDDLLHKVDMASMAHGLECRGPFLDHRVVELALAMPLERKLRLRRGRSKVVLKQAFADMLPAAIRTRSKMGFGVPLDRWFRGPLRHELRAVLLDPIAQKRGLFRPAAVEQMIIEHEQGRRDHAYRLWALLMLELWFRHHLDEIAV
jgi:asparagine synthase (glutamine-hydrolysing)